MPHHTERLSVSQRSAADLRAQLSTLVYHKMEAQPCGEELLSYQKAT